MAKNIKFGKTYTRMYWKATYQVAVKEHDCAHCNEPIEPGQDYYKERPFGKTRRFHAAWCWGAIQEQRKNFIKTGSPHAR